MSTATRILVVDDEPQITHVLETSLTANGYEVRCADDGEEALNIFGQWQPDLIITDLSMPKMGGIALCRAIRSSSDVPIIVLSVKDREVTKVQALECGADDYITKPFGTDELLARVRVALRRTSITWPPRGQRLTLGDFCIDFAAHRVNLKGEPLILTPKEFELLAFCLRKTDQILTYKAILTAIWGRAFTDQPHTVHVLVRQLRQKIEPNPTIPIYLKTEPSIGYRFEPGP